MKETIAITIESMRGGGTQKVVSRLMEGLVNHGLRVHLITILGSDTDFFEVPAKVKRHVLSSSGPSSNPLSAIYRNLRRIFEMRRAVRESGCTCLISLISTHNIIAVLSCIGLDVQVIISERNDPRYQRIGFVWTLLRRLVYPRAAFVTANSPQAISYLESIIPKDRLRFLPNPVATFRNSSKPVCPHPFFLAVGRLNQQKAFDVLIKAYASACLQSALLPLFILGKGPEEIALKEQIERHGLKDDVTLVGEVVNVGDYYNQSIALIHPARFEGMPNVVLEAMGTGTPVVVSNSQLGILDLVCDEKNGLIFKKDDVEQLAKIIVRLASDEAFRDSLGRQAQISIMDRLNNDGVSAWLDIIEIVTKSKTKRFQETVSS